MTDGFAAVSRRRNLGKNVIAELIATPPPRAAVMLNVFQHPPRNGNHRDLLSAGS
ncbi:hypothetical protein [Sphingomonas sp. PAMC 26617]|uniref:hypothetical protein n=1 Tax=Sphingomonas sp. PAMC 26617 TaxID=1112216 RepID=UPI0012F521A8|nr:hypothetical protein [Sphingomonas sp. PAMC 26617]